MLFGIFDHVERRTDVDPAQQFDERIQLVQLAERAGFYCYHVAEHHHSPLSLTPNQAVYLAAVAQHTSRIRLATLVSVLPLHHPVRLIEEICLIDQLSHGRFEVGVGRGTDRAQEWRMWGGDAAVNDDRFDESLDIVIKGLQTEFLTHHGEYYDFSDLWMSLRPVQQPHPPFWWPGNPVHAGEWGMNFIIGGRSPLAEMPGMIAQYLDATKASPTRGLAGRTPPLYGAQKHILITETDKEAQARMPSAYAALRSHYVKPLPGGKVDPAEIPRPATLDLATILQMEALVVGSPATVRGYLQRYAEVSGANYFVGSFHWGDLTHAEASRSMELFASDVMPAIT